MLSKSTVKQVGGVLWLWITEFIVTIIMFFVLSETDINLFFDSSAIYGHH